MLWLHICELRLARVLWLKKNQINIITLFLVYMQRRHCTSVLLFKINWTHTRRYNFLIVWQQKYRIFFVGTISRISSTTVFCWLQTSNPQNRNYEVYRVPQHFRRIWMFSSLTLRVIDNLGHQSLLETYCKMDWFLFFFRLLEAFFPPCYKAIATYSKCLVGLFMVACSCFVVEIK